MTPFQQIPSDVLVPLFYAEVDPSHANTAQAVQRTLIIGQFVGNGYDITTDVPHISSGVKDAALRAGSGSVLALATAAYRAFDQFGEVWYGPLGNDSGFAGVSATGTIAFSAATSDGTLNLYIAGQRVQVAITNGMTATAVGVAVYRAINEAIDLPVRAANALGTVTLTANNRGLIGNDIDIRLNYRGSRGGEITPLGIAPVITAMSGGTGSPPLDALLANLGDMAFDFIVCPYNDPASTASLTAFLSDSAGRWSWTNQLYGHAFIAYRGSLTQATTFGATLNDPHTTCMPAYDSPTPYWVWAAAYAADAAVSARADPALPIRGLPILGVLAPPIQNRYPLPSRQTLLSTGQSTFKVDAGDNITVEKLVTTYQTDSFGLPDNSYRNLETMFTLTAVLRRLAGVVTGQFSRVKLAADGTNFAPGSGIVTPSIIRGALIAAYREMEFEGLVQQADAFAAGLVVEQDSENPNRVNVLYPAVLINQLDIFAALVQFRL